MMRIFVAFGYNKRDAWVRELVIPLIEAFGGEAVTGEELQGEIVSEAVRQRIATSGGLIAFATRRDKLVSGGWNTHRWVTDELSLAIGRGQRVVEVRESEVDSQGGNAGDRQVIHYDEVNRDRCLIELAKILSRWHQDRDVRLQLIPEECAQEIFPLLTKPGFRSVYRLYIDGEEYSDRACRILPVVGGLHVQVRDVPRDALIQLEVNYLDRTWRSRYQGTDALRIEMEKD
jgi:hypothetical protein